MDLMRLVPYLIASIIFGARDALWIGDFPTDETSGPIGSGGDPPSGSHSGIDRSGNATFIQFAYSIPVFRNGAPGVGWDDVLRILYAISILFYALRAISFFRGFLSFATLVYSIGVILTRIRSFMLVLFLVHTGFSFSLFILLQDFPDECEDDKCATQYSSVTWFFGMSLGLALFGEPIHEGMAANIWDERKGEREHPINHGVKSSIHFLFLFTMQVVLLNLLIALMAEARTDALQEASLNALRRRADIILEMQQLGGGRGVWEYMSALMRLFRSRRSSRVGAAPATAVDDGARGQFLRQNAVRQNSRTPKLADGTRDRWLHVLVPDELDYARELIHDDAGRKNKSSGSVLDLH